MPETIESFVAKLQAEGVEAGKQAAEKLKANAKKQAEKTLADAQEQAEKIVADAKAEAENTLTRGRTELSLAARDTVLKLRDSLDRALSAILAEGVKAKLEDTDFLSQVLHELVVLYAQADREHRTLVKINVPKALHEQLVGWAFQEIGKDLQDAPSPSIDLKGTLSQAGFEYEVSGATVEVTLDAVVETLREMVAPALRDLLDEAVKNDAE
jgi:vacuolar-type H+-ATPase subunit E/Vma4